MTKLFVRTSFGAEEDEAPLYFQNIQVFQKIFDSFSKNLLLLLTVMEHQVF